MSILNEKLTKVLNSIKDVGAYDKGIETILMDGFALSLRTIQEVAKKDKNKRLFDIEDQIKMVSNALGFSIEDIVIKVIDAKNSEIQQMQQQGQQQQQYPTGTFDPNKEVDNDTLSFIIGTNSENNSEWKKEKSDEEITNIIMNSHEVIETKDSNLNDYERFLAKAKENLNFLKTQI